MTIGKNGNLAMEQRSEIFQRKVWSMRSSRLQIAGLTLLCLLSACQRPTQRLPPAPVFEFETASSKAAEIPSPAPTEMQSDDLGQADGVVPGSFEDFIRYAGSDKVYFDYDKSDLRADAMATLSKQAEWLQKYPAVNVSLEGHADERGTREYNFALGERRAAAMRFYMLSKGIDSARMSVTSFGRERPVAAGSDEESWQLNRRGETALIGAVGQ